MLASQTLKIASYPSTTLVAKGIDMNELAVILSCFAGI